MKKRILSVIMAAVLCAGLPFVSNAEETGAGEGAAVSEGTGLEGEELSPEDWVYPTGLEPMEIVELDSEQANPDYIIDLDGGGASSEQPDLYSQYYTSEWDRYKNYYIYNQLTDEEKEFWDALDKLCMEYLTTKKIPDNNVFGTYVLGYVGSSSLTTQQMKNLAWMFYYENPQYYFLLNNVGTMSQGGRSYCSLTMYSDFADGVVRANETAKVKAQADAWHSRIDSCSTEEEKLKTINDLIVEKVEYGESKFYQSAYSVFCDDRTVCAGYAKAMEMMCNGSGIEAMSVTSDSHEWNKVRIRDSWYNVDATWADQSWGISYRYFGRSDAFYDNDSSSLSHQEKEMWEAYLPECTLDATPSEGHGPIPGQFPSVTKTVQKPSVKVTAKEGGFEVAIACATPGAKIYYTLDGKEPSPAASKSFLYSEPIVLSGNVQLKAVAVCNEHLDSGVVERTMSGQQPAPEPEPDETKVGDLTYRGGKYYFYENGVMAVSKEAFVNGAWRWFDADGSMAVNKDVYQTSSGGKWVRYNENGEMIKGEDYRYGGYYYFEPITGTMVKGPVVLEDGRKVFYDTVSGRMLKGQHTISGQSYRFDANDGHLISGQDTNFWINADGKDFWYENWQRQGWDPGNNSYRGKEIYDPSSDAWYWLDNVQHGGKAVSKDVYQESYSAYPDREDGTGKWVRYDGNGHMIKGWQTTAEGTFYFEKVTGAMAKGQVEIDGTVYYFDENTGIRQW